MNRLKRDIATIIDQKKIWFYLSRQDVKSRFRRSKIGILWIVIHQLAFSFGGGVIWANIFSLNPGEFIPFLTIGFAMWGFISAVLVESSGAFVIAHGYLKQLPINPVVFIARSWFTNVIYMIMSIIIAVLLAAGFGSFHIEGIPFLIIGLILVCAAGLSVTSVMAYIGLRFRDIPHAISGVMSLLFVVTPVIYPPDILRSRGLGFFVDINPAAAVVSVVRTPIIEGTPALLQEYLMLGAILIIFTISYIALAKNWSAKINYWI